MLSLLQREPQCSCVDVWPHLIFSNDLPTPFCMSTSEIHIGKEIEAELRTQKRSVSWFARKLNCERTNVYSIFHRHSIDTALLYRIFIILNKNFFAIYLEALSIFQDKIEMTEP